MASMRVARVVLRSEDVGRSAAFYERVAGLGIRSEDGERAELGAPDGGPVVLELRRSAAPGPSPRRATGLFHTAFLYPTRPQLAQTLRELAQARVELTGLSDHLVSEAIYLDDPDGLGIELYYDRPREDWPDPLRLDTLPLDVDSLLTEAAPERDPGGGVSVGHVHLKVADIEPTVGFWTAGLGFDLIAKLGDQAAFLSTNGYHHHVGGNTWFSAGMGPEPPEGPGLEEVVLAVADDPGLAAARSGLEAVGAPLESTNGAVVTRTPDGIRVRLESESA
jgi:catechol 2,3-dioxygenase